MDKTRSIMDIKKYGKIKIKLSEIMDKKEITRNKLSTLTGVKYDVVNRYYIGNYIERVDLDFIAKVCYVLECKIEDLFEYVID